MKSLRSAAAFVLFLAAASAPLAAQQVAPELRTGAMAGEPADAPGHAADRVLIKFLVDATPQQIDSAFRPHGVRWLESGEGRAFEVLQVPEGTVADWVSLLSAQPWVEYAEPDFLAHALDTPNDTYFFPYQWNFYDAGVPSNGVPSWYGVQGQSAWNLSTGSNVTVAIVDTGVAYENYGNFLIAPDLAGATFVAPRNYVNNTTHANDDNGHGTHVCGTVRQTTNNALGCAGLARNVRIMPVKVLNSAGSGTHSWIANGIRWAADNGAFAINLSLGSSSGSSTLSSAVNYAWGKGCVLAAATGNSGAARISYPARYTNCIAVGATRFDGSRSYYSQYGTGIDIVAPGGDVTVDQNGDGYGDGILQQTFQGSPTSFAYYFFQGTSMATPHVAAAAALVKAYRPAYTNTQVRNALQNSAYDLGAAGYDTQFGYGLLDAYEALFH